MTNQAGSQRWIVLGVGFLGLIAGCASQYGLAYLIPALRAEGLALETPTTLVIFPSLATATIPARDEALVG